MRKHIVLNGAKGIYTFDEVCHLLRSHGINFKIAGKSQSKTKPLKHNKTTGLLKRKAGET